MSTLVTLAFRPEDLVSYDDNFNVVSSVSYGVSNYGTSYASVDSTTGALILPSAGLYRVTGMVVGTVSEDGFYDGYINLPPDQLSPTGYEPSYPSPFYLGFQQNVAASDTFTAGFSGLLFAEYYYTLSLYLRVGIAPVDPFARLFIEAL